MASLTGVAISINYIYHQNVFRKVKAELAQELLAEEKFRSDDLCVPRITFYKTMTAAIPISGGGGGEGDLLPTSHDEESTVFGSLRSTISSYISGARTSGSRTKEPEMLNRLERKSSVSSDEGLLTVSTDN